MSTALAGFLAERYIEVSKTPASDESLVKVTVRLSAEYVVHLDDMAKKLDMSRTALAASILEHAILDATHIMRDPVPVDHVEEVYRSIDVAHQMRDDIKFDAHYYEKENP